MLHLNFTLCCCVKTMSDKTKSIRGYFPMDKRETKSEMTFRLNILQNDTKSKKECKKVCPYFEAFADFYSFFLLIPFRLKFDHETSQYKIVSFRFRKIIVSMIHCIYITIGFVLVFKIVDSFVHKRRDIGTAFYAGSNIGTFAAMLQIFKIFHWNQDEICHLMNHCSVQMNIRAIRKARFMVFFICLLNGCINIINEVLTSIGEADMIRVSSIFNIVVSPAFQLIGINPLNCLRLMFSDAVLHFAAKLILGCHYVAFNIALPSMLVLSLTMVTLAKCGFIKNIEQNYGNVSLVLAEYTSLRKTTELLTRVFGSFILKYYICVLCFFALFPQIVLNHDAPDGLVRIFLGVYMGCIVTAMHQAANFHTEVDKCLRTCISHHNWQDDWNLDYKHRLKLIALTQEIDAKPIAVSCSFFSITQNFLSSSISLVITYGLIVFQVSNNTSKGFWNSEE